MKTVLLLLNKALFVTLLFIAGSSLIANEINSNKETTDIVTSEDEAKKLFLFQHLDMPKDSDGREAMV